MNIIDQETGEATVIELQSPEINELATAMAKAQGEMTSAQKDGQNPHFKSSYATLNSIIQATRKPLSGHGLCVVQSLSPDNILITTLMHESGQWMRSYLRLNPAQNTPQGIGSALTYARRYSLAAIVGISQDDDDGEEGSQSSAPRDTQTKQPAPPAPSPALQPQATNGGNGHAEKPLDKIQDKPAFRFPSTAAKKFYDEVQAATNNGYDSPFHFMKVLGNWFNFASQDLWDERKSYMVDHIRTKQEAAAPVEVENQAVQDEIPF